MKLKFLQVVLVFILHLVAVGCSNHEIEANSDPNEHLKKIAWEYLEAKGWNNTAIDWQSAVVTKTTVNTDYELLDKSYIGKKVSSVSFEDKANVSVSTPSILIDTTNNKVVGYLPGE